jgi:hypothetical protein
LKAFKKFAADRKSVFPVSLQLAIPQNPKMEKLAADMAHDRNKASKQEKWFCKLGFFSGSPT